MTYVVYVTDTLGSHELHRKEILLLELLSAVKILPSVASIDLAREHQVEDGAY